MTKQITPYRFIALAMVYIAMLPAPTMAQTLNCPQPLVYGDYSVTCGGTATIIVRPDGTRNVSGCASADAAPFTNGLCTVSQSFPFQTIQVSAPASATITHTGGSPSMTLDNFNLVTNNGGNTYLTSSPFTNVPIGAQLNMPASPTNGTYNGTITITAVFQ
ncbi:MAG: DUF4402 domain-containing protein [Alphaproteobacteria bacterium]|nr:DUF4402 domain-containing protein [Alphaproteobacteria bacterium]